MAKLRELTVTLLDWETRAVLHALANEKQRLLEISRTSTDENEAADAGNDCFEISELLERLQSEAKAVFGDQIVVFENRPA